MKLTTTLLLIIAIILFLAFAFGDTPTIITALFVSLVICGVILINEYKKYGKVH